MQPCKYALCTCTTLEARPSVSLPPLDMVLVCMYITFLVYMIQAKELDTVAHVTVEASENVNTGNEQVRQVS